MGCHHKTKDRTRPLGCIPTSELRNARKHIHKILDPMWKDGKTRRKVYKKIGDHFGHKYHTANIRSVDEAREVYKFIKTINKEYK